jgi:hypothetical protein
MFQKTKLSPDLKSLLQLKNGLIGITYLLYGAEH